MVLCVVPGVPVVLPLPLPVSVPVSVSVPVLPVSLPAVVHLLSPLPDPDLVLQSLLLNLLVVGGGLGLPVSSLALPEEVRVGHPLPHLLLLLLLVLGPGVQGPPTSS